MPIQLDKILNDIANEKVLHPNCRDTAVKKDVDDAWARVGKKNGLSGKIYFYYMYVYISLSRLYFMVGS